MMKITHQPLWKNLIVLLLFVLMVSACKTAAESDAEGMDSATDVPVSVTDTDTPDVEVIDPTATKTPMPTPTEEPTALPTETPTATVEPTEIPTRVPINTREPIPTNTVVFVTPEPTATPKPVVFLSTTSLYPGESFVVSAASFPPNVDIDYWLYDVNSTTQLVYDGFTDANGAALITLVMPSSATAGQRWQVNVHTTEVQPSRSANSTRILILGATTGGGSPKVYLSSTSLSAGDTFTTSVTGFPANSNIDFKLSNSDGTKVALADGFTNADGEASASITVPASAVVGEQWTVSAYTTELVIQTRATSGVITIQ